MELYDAIIRRTREYLSACSLRRYPYDVENCWKETASGEMILLRDAAYELGGGNCESVNYTCATSDQELLKENEILLYGKDLPEITRDTSFARIIFLRTDAADSLEGEEELYRFVRELEYVRYHIFPKGYMVRTSAKSSQEQARVSKDALRAGINFKRLGSTYIRKYLKNPRVRNVQVLFLTGMKELEPFLREAQQTDMVTGALNHILKGMPMNCKTCDLKAICDEVEGMRSLHQKNR